MEQRQSFQTHPEATAQKMRQHKFTFIIWLAIYPLVTVLHFLIGDYLNKLPAALGTLVSTLIAVPVMVYLLVPLYSKWFSRWLN
jgi:antibiotic biosynthesis monooxygenase (ABM) superfamily enzyme